MEPFAFVTSLAAGQILAQQLHHGTGSGTTSMGPPKRPMMPVTRPAKESSNLPTCPMVYAIISDMSIFGNPNVPDSHYSAYPPQVPVNTPVLPALVPLGLVDVTLNVECHISTAFVTVEGTWDLNCVRSRATCDCLLALPMDHQGTVASVEIDMGHGRLYTTIVVPRDEAASYGARGSPGARVDDPGTYNPELFRLSLPQVEGGTKLGLKITWFQPMEFVNGLYSVRVPFVFPEDTIPLATEVASITAIKCTINSGTCTAVEVGSFNNPMKEIFRVPGRVTFENGGKESWKDWKNQDFVGSYQVWSGGIFPNLIFQDSVSGESDTRGTFCLSISPPDPKSIQVFRRAVVFLLDRSGSMYGEPLEDARQALLFGLDSLNPEDSFNIIAFDHELVSFSSQMEHATSTALGHAREWATTKCTARGGTDILKPLQQAFLYLENFPEAVPYVFLITDGAVANERDICRRMQSRIAALGPRAPRISTFGIGHYCNYYFLKMLAVIGSGLSDVAFTPGKICRQMERLLVAASTPLLTNITVANMSANYEPIKDFLSLLPQFVGLGMSQVYPFPIPDLFCGNPLVVSGRFHGSFPESITVSGLLPDRSTWQTEVPSRRTLTVPLSKVFAKQQLDLFTAQAWLQGDKTMEQEAVDLSVATGIPCEYTRMIGFETTRDRLSQLLHERAKGKKINVNKYTVGKAAGIVLIGGLAIGFGSIAATAANAVIGDALGSILGSFGNAPDGCCCCCDLERLVGDGMCPWTVDLPWLGDCLSCCSDLGGCCDSCGDNCSGCGEILAGCCDSCGDSCSGCAEILAGCCELFFGCLTGLLS